MGTKAAAARRHRRRAVRLEHLAAAPLHRPGQPVADHRRARATAAPRRWPRRSSRKDAELFSDHLRLRRRLQPPTTATRPAWSATGRCATCSSRASGTRGHRVQGGLVRADTLPLVLPVLGAERPAARRPGARRAGRHRPDHAGRAAAPCWQRLDAAPVPRPRRDEDDSEEETVAGPIAHRDGRRRYSEAEAERRAGRPPRRLSRPREPEVLSTLQIALGISVAVHGGAAGGALRRPRGLQPHVPGHAAGGDPGQRPLQREGPTKAQAIAQANLAGGGEAEKGRATSPLPPSALTQLGDAAEEAQQARSTRCRSSRADARAGRRRAGRDAAARPEAANRAHRETARRRRSGAT